MFAGASNINSKDYVPLASSSNNFKIEASDKKKIDSLRTWINTYFIEKKSLFYNFETKLKDRFNSNNTNDGDVTLKVVYKNELDDKIIYHIMDETDGCELHAFKYFNFINENDVIRLRSFKGSEQ